MINNLHNQLMNLYNNRTNKNEAGGAADLAKRLRDKQLAVRGGADKTAEEQAANEADAKARQTETAAGKKRPTLLDAYTRSNEPQGKARGHDKHDKQDKDEVELSSEEKRQAALKKIMDKLDAEEAARHPNRVKDKDKTSKQDGVTDTKDAKKSNNISGVEGLLNDLPLFNEFKSSLIDAFKSMDSATSGSISAQYELNYSTMQYIAAEGGGYEYKETNFNLKFDLNYVKAAGGKTGSEIAAALESATDFASLVSSLEEVGAMSGQQAGDEQAGETGEAEQTKGIPEFKGMKPEDFLGSVKDYFGPEATSGRIVDFAAMFFPLSSEFKDGGDTEEARQKFSDRMGKAIQKGFDQAIGQLGSMPKDVMDGINKTHELTFKGLEDFVKNGMNKEKEEKGVYDSLEAFAFSFEMSYSEKSVSVSSYNSRGQTQSAGQTNSVNAEA